MNAQKVQYRFETNPDGTWTIKEFMWDGTLLDYELSEPTYVEAYNTLQYVKILEEVYSQPRQ